MKLKYSILEERNGEAWFRINRPDKLNSLNKDVFADLEAVIIRSEQSESIKAFILTCDEKDFAAGADVEYLTKADVLSVAE
jgi:enoyl-CoA hydratase/carnithine racemase